MATNYPGSLDTGTEQPSPLSTTEMDDAGFEHDVVHTNHSGAIIALETKVGVGSSSAVADSVLAGTGSGTSGWTTTPTVVDLTATGNVDITGTLAVDGIVTLGDEIKGGSGSAADPVFTFSSDGNTGMYPHAADQLGFTAGGTQRMVITTAGIFGYEPFRAPLGSAAEPSFAFDGDTDTGFYRGPGSGVVSWSGNSTQGGYLWYGGIRTLDGTAGSPAFSFMNDTNTGMYRVSSDRIGFSCGGVLTQEFRNDGIHLASGDWFRSYGTTGWYNGSYGGGWYMTDTTWVRTYNNKGMVCNGIAATLFGTSSTSGYQYVMRNTTYGTLGYYTSTREVKENIVDVTSADSGAWMDALQPVMFNEKWLREEEEPAEHQTWREADVQVGFIAEDVLGDSVVSQFAQVNEEDGVLKPVGWKWECVIAAAVAEIKSLRARVAALEAA